MPLLITWWLGLSLEGLVMVRGVQSRLLVRFPKFYSYMFFVLAADILKMVSYRWYPEIYASLYWVTQFVSLVLGSVVVFEIYRLGLREFPGTARMARNLLGIVFSGVFIRVIVGIHEDSPEWINGAYVRLERDLRTVQSLAIVVLVLLLLGYAIPLGRNLGGILLGYGVFVATSVMQLSLVSHYGRAAETFWGIVQPASYLLVLGIWVRTLWAADEITGRSRGSGGGDYGSLANATSARLEQARTRLGSAVRP